MSTRTPVLDRCMAGYFWILHSKDRKIEIFSYKLCTTTICHYALVETDKELICRRLTARRCMYAEILSTSSGDSTVTVGMCDVACYDDAGDPDPQRRRGNFEWGRVGL